MKSLGLLTVCAVVEVLKRSGHPAHSQPPRDPRALWSWNITPPHPEPKPNLIVVASLPLFVLLGRRLSFFERRPLDAQPPLPHLVVAPGVLFNGTDQYADALQDDLDRPAAQMCPRDLHLHIYHEHVGTHNRRNGKRYGRFK